MFCPYITNLNIRAIMAKTGPAGQVKHPLLIAIMRMNLVSRPPCRLACSARAGDNGGYQLLE
jgi:hypothetical protein